MCHGIRSEGDGGAAHCHDGGVEGSTENQEGDRLEHGRSFRLVDAVSLQGDGLVALEAVTVHPLSLAALAVPQQRQDGTAGSGVLVLHRGVAEPADPNAARDGVGGHCPDAGGVVAVDGESHGVV